MNTLPLTRKREQWVKNRRTTLRGKPLHYNIALQQKYERQLTQLVKQMTTETKKEVLKLFQSTTGKKFFKNQAKVEVIKKPRATQDASLGSQARILMNALTSAYTQLFDQKSKTLAERMLNATIATSKTMLHGSLEELSGGLSLKTSVVPAGMEDVVKASIEENVSLIRSIPAQYFKDITGAVMRSITTGQGLKDLVPEIAKYEGQTKRRARNIALDQTRKAYNSINKQRMMALGVKEFIWRHSGGSQFPRESHIKISGVKFSFANLEQEQAALGVPERDRGICGEPINCKCFMQPVISFED